MRDPDALTKLGSALRAERERQGKVARRSERGVGPSSQPYRPDRRRRVRTHVEDAHAATARARLARRGVRRRRRRGR